MSRETAIDNILLILRIAVEKDEISKADLCRALHALSSAMNSEEDEGRVAQLNESLTDRYEHCFRIYYGKDQ